MSIQTSFILMKGLEMSAILHVCQAFCLYKKMQYSYILVNIRKVMEKRTKIVQMVRIIQTAKLGQEKQTLELKKLIQLSHSNTA